MRRNVFATGLLLSVSTLIASSPLTAQSPYQSTERAPRGFDRTQAQTETEAYLVKRIGIDTHRSSECNEKLYNLLTSRGWRISTYLCRKSPALLH
jgi:hypothetical protein